MRGELVNAAKPPDDYEITGAMMRFGGSFVRTLGELARRADPENLNRLKAAFPEFWSEYTDVALMRRQRAAEARS